MGRRRGLLALGPGTLPVRECLLKIVFPKCRGLPCAQAMLSMSHALPLIHQLWVSQVINAETEGQGG